MIKNKFLLIIVLSCPVLYSNAQLNNFNLSSYKLPDLKRRALETNFNLSGSNDYYKFPSQSIYYLSPTKIASNSYNGNTNINYSHYLNNVNYQRKSSSGLNILYTFNNNKENKELGNKTKYFNSYLYFSRENRKYFTSSYFRETDIDIDYQYEIDKNSTTNTYGTTDNDDIKIHSLSSVVPLKIGKGRIEPIQDVRHAIYIFEELSKVDRLPASIKDDEIIEFAEFISKLKNKRFFDSRLRKIAEIEAIDSFLVDKKYLNIADAKYFTVLNDIWNYGNTPYRNNGTRLSFALYPGFYLHDSYQEINVTYGSTYGYKMKTLGLDAGLELRHEKPINLYWQHSIGFDGYFGFINGKLNVVPNLKNDIRIPNIQFELSHSIGYYPNTRTDFSFGYSAKYLEMFDRSDDENEVFGLKGKAAKLETYLSVNYYFSPKFRISAESMFFYIWQGSKNDAFINLDNISKADYFENGFAVVASNYPSLSIDRRRFNNTRVSLIYSIL